MKFELNNIVRKNIRSLVPYSSARSEFKGKASVFLDANENSFGSPGSMNYNRYPDPYQTKLKERIAELRATGTEKIFVGNGSDEVIDLLFRIFCEPGKEEVIICPPTYGMYEVSANINDVKIKKVPLIAETFQLDVKGITEAITSQTRMIFVCCPNNPTGNGVKWSDIQLLLKSFNGIVVVDEAYIDFASYPSLIRELDAYPNMVIMQTLSKAWGLAGIRIGLAFASAEIISILNKVKPPYNVSQSSQEIALESLRSSDMVNNWITTIVRERNQLHLELEKLSLVKKVYPSEANFLLVKVKDADAVYSDLVKMGIITRNRNKVELCEDCIRITVGTEKENEELLNAMKKLV